MWQSAQPAGCADCHMSLYPGVCVPGGSGGEGCPSGTRFEPRKPGERAVNRVAAGSLQAKRVSSHYFTSVDVPLAEAFPDAFAEDTTLDAAGQPLGLKWRRDALLRRTFEVTLDGPRRSGDRLEIPVRILNVGAGHRVPAGFSQEREIWIEMTVKDARGAVVYQVGKIDRDDADLRDKIFLRVNTRETSFDREGRPLGVFGADVIDGPDVPRWKREGTQDFRGQGLVNLQNGFFRCVKCIGFVDPAGKCQPLAGQGRTRADRYDDGIYDADTGECRSNLRGGEELFETYFPVGALDADRGILKAPDAIIDTRSAAPGVPLRYVYDLDARGRQGPFKIEARLRFRAFPPYLIRAFAEYEALQRPQRPQVTERMLRRIDIVDLASLRAEVP
jgi:hypothetical protein